MKKMLKRLANAIDDYDNAMTRDDMVEALMRVKKLTNEIHAEADALQKKTES